MTDERKLDLSEGMQKHVLAAIFKDASIMARVRSVLNPDYFTDEAVSDVVAWTNQHWDTYKQIPSKAALIDVFKSPEEHKPHRRTIRRAFEEEVPDPAHTIDRIVKYARNVAMRQAVYKCAEYYDAESKGEELKDDKGKVIKINPEKLLRDANAVGQDLTDMGHFIDAAYVEQNKNSILLPDLRETFTTGITHLDEAGLRLRRGELGCVLGVAKTGKTQTLMAIAMGNLRQGKNVLWYNCEMPEDQMDLRVFRRIAGAKADIKDDPRHFLAKLQERMAKIVNGKFLLKKYIANKVTVDDMRAHMTQCVSNGFVPDVVICDYLGLVSSSGHEKEYENFDEAWLQFRSFVQEFNVAGWSAAQSNRVGVGCDNIDMRHIAKGFSIAGHIDAGVSINMTEAEQAACIGHYYVFASRNAAGRVIVPFEHDFSRSLILSTGITLPAGEKKQKGKDKAKTSDAEKAAFATAMENRRKNDQQP